MATHRSRVAGADPFAVGDGLWISSQRTHDVLRHLHKVRRLTLLFLMAMAARAGSIKGIVVEHVSGKALARTVVRLEPIPGTATPPQPYSVRTTSTGQYFFTRIPAGLYRIVAERLGYFPAMYGQRRPDGQAAPVAVTAESDLFAEIRLRRLGAITGTVLDENGVGMAGVTVVAYKATLPLRAVASGTADDRGVYRIGGLTPGRYWVRTAGHRLEDGSGRAPTYSPQGAELRHARSFQVRLDDEAPDAHVRPEPGFLFNIKGDVACDRIFKEPITITITSETGRQSVQAFCESGYQVSGLPPMLYEVLARNQDGSMVFFEEVFVQSNTTVPVQMAAPPQIDIDAGKATSIELTGRRADLAVLEPVVKIPMPRTWLIPGYWNLTATVGPNQYVESITHRRDVRRPWRTEYPSDAHQIFVEQRRSMRMQVNVVENAAHISGVVITNGNKAVAGSPVFLWPVSDGNRRILGGSRQVLSDVDGRFRFDGLPPGDYRVLATFDASEITPELIEESQARAIRVQPSEAATVDLPLWIAP